MANWDDLRFFLAIARNGTLSAAARALDVSQPTVARRLTQLERGMSASLFQRGTTSLTLTERGEQVLRLVEGIERQTRSIERLTARGEDQRAPLVRLATTRGLAVHWLAPRVAQLRSETGVRLHVHVGLSRSDLLGYEADIALRMGWPGEDDLHGRRVGSAHCGLYASAEYLDRRGAPESLQELCYHDLLESEGALAEVPQARALREWMTEPVPLAADCATVQIGLARRGLGIGAFPCFMADPDPELVRILPEDFDVAVPLWALVNPSLHRDSAVRRVFDFIVRGAVSFGPELCGGAARRGSSTPISSPTHER